MKEGIFFKTDLTAPETPLILCDKLGKSEVTQSSPNVFNPMDFIARQAPLSMGFSRQENWSGFPSLLQGIFPTEGLNPGLLHCRQILYHLSQQGGPQSLMQGSMNARGWFAPVLLAFPGR